jgi:hypothetical protein
VILPSLKTCTLSFLLCAALNNSWPLRAAPLLVFDTTPDDGRFGFDGNLPDFDATLIGEKKILSQMDVATAGAEFPANYDMPLGWPKPSWGKWEVREVYVLDVRKVPARAAGYYYGKRIMYLDRQFFGALWLDLYDSAMRKWKIALLQPIVLPIPGTGVAEFNRRVVYAFLGRPEQTCNVRRPQRWLRLRCPHQRKCP